MGALLRLCLLSALPGSSLKVVGHGLFAQGWVLQELRLCDFNLEQSRSWQVDVFPHSMFEWEIVEKLSYLQRYQHTW